MNLDFDEYDEFFKIILVGDTGTGKTNIGQTFDKGSVPNYTTPTVGVDYYSKNISVDSTHKVKMQIWDTAGQEQYRSIIMGHYKNAVGALVVFDVTNRTSFQNVRNWIYDVRERAAQHVVIGIIGNKIDLSNRVVSREDGQNLANQEQAFYLETTIHDIRSLKKVFQRLAEQTYRSSRSKNLQFSQGVSLQKKNKEESNCPC